MKIINTQATCIAKIAMQVGYRTSSRLGIGFRVDEREDNGGGFSAFLPHSIENLIKVSTEIIILCIPKTDFTGSVTVLAVHYVQGETLVEAWALDDYWHEMWKFF